MIYTPEITLYRDGVPTFETNRSSSRARRPKYVRSLHRNIALTSEAAMGDSRGMVVSPGEE